MRSTLFSRQEAFGAGVAQTVRMVCTYAARPCASLSLAKSHVHAPTTKLCLISPLSTCDHRQQLMPTGKKVRRPAARAAACFMWRVNCLWVYYDMFGNLFQTHAFSHSTHHFSELLTVDTCDCDCRLLLWAVRMYASGSLMVEA